MAFCSMTGRLYFVDGMRVKYVTGDGRVEETTLQTDKREITSLEVVPNYLLYTLQGESMVRQFNPRTGERSVFMMETPARVAAVYPITGQAPQGKEKFPVLIAASSNTTPAQLGTGWSTPSPRMERSW